MRKSSTVSVKNFSFRVNKDELTGESRIYLIEETKDSTNYVDFNDIIEFFNGMEGLSMTIKVDKEFDGE